MSLRHSADYIRRRLLARSVVDEATGCREWGRAKRGGYGRLWDGERVVDTHRLSYEVFVGPIPAGLDVLHRCDNPGCIEPEHLCPGTPADNRADRDAKGRHRNGADKIRGLPSKSRGEKHGLAKLTEGEAREIKARLRAGPMKAPLMAREYGVSESLIRGIRDGRNWGWL
jgi:hypothetical protein